MNRAGFIDYAKLRILVEFVSRGYDLSLIVEDAARRITVSRPYRDGPYAGPLNRVGEGVRYSEHIHIVVLLFHVVYSLSRI